MLVNSSEERERIMREKLKAGEVVQMHHPGRGICYVDNTPQAIDAKRRQGFTDVEYEEEVVRTPKAVPAKPKDDTPAKRGPGRPRKSETEDGE